MMICEVVMQARVAEGENEGMHQHHVTYAFMEPHGATFSLNRNYATNIFVSISVHAQPRRQT